ncbi:MAG: murein transglycosylase [Myxococcales bacterium]|nr:murein transglycosylase [Myxococcales bacterium]
MHANVVASIFLANWCQTSWRQFATRFASQNASVTCLRRSGLVFYTRHLALGALMAACGARQAPCPTPVQCPAAAEPSSPAEPEPVVVRPEVATEPEPKLILEPVSFTALPGWQLDSVGDALPALLRSCARLAKRRDSQLVGRDEVGGTAGQWRDACAAAKRVAKTDHAAARAFFEEHFRPFLAKNNDESEGRFTGYYEASLRGSRKRKGPYQTPLYMRPKDLVMVNMRNFTSKPSRRRIAGRVVNGLLRPYESRKKIRKGALRGKKLELVWIDDKVDGFFTQIQGSGLVKLSDGKEMRIGYAGQNGHSYTAIGRELVRDGHITRAEMSMQAIRDWLANNPGKADEMMDRNEAYVFFTELSGAGPVGSQNVELTPERSAAIDRNFIPQSVPLFINTQVPTEDGTKQRLFRQLVIAQDSGGAIRGPVRADIFWGSSARGAAIAGRLKSRGTYYLLLPTAVAQAHSTAPSPLIQ